ncbi:MAG: sensor histidine kinase N-terminal domain-containing protein [Betaproteobacteria bacterium]
MTPSDEVWSLRRRLTSWLLVPLVVWSLGSTALAYLLALHFTTEAYDRSLQAAILDLERQITVVDGEPRLDLPEAVLKMLEWNEADRVYYRVQTVSGKLLAGDADLPSVPRLKPGQTRYYDGAFGSATVRAAAAYARVPGTEDAIVLEVAESTDARRAITREILFATLIPETVLIIISAMGVWYGVGRGLGPLARLEQEISRRSDRDLSPVHTRRAPREVRPLVDAINALLARLDSALAAHRRFVANAAHQLRTPLAGLRTQTELALRETDVDAMKVSLSQVQQSAGRAARLVNQMLSLAHLEPRSGRPLQAERLKLSELARDTTARWVPKALTHSIDLGFNGCDGPAVVFGDRLLLEEMLGNLIDNAIRYTPAGGEVTVSVLTREDVSVLSVEDTGPGIPEHERSNVLERFHRGSTAGSSEGSGLGLAIVREIAVTHGARLSIDEGDPRQGTRVRIIFPAHS